MSPECPFKRQGLFCPVPSDLAEVSGVCDTDNRGGVCGPAVAYNGVLSESKFFQIADVVDPIQGVFEILRSPSFPNSPMHALPDLLVGVIFPVRQTAEEVFDRHGIMVNEDDLVLSLFAYGRGWATSDLSSLRTLELGPHHEWIFLEQDGELRWNQESISSADYYGGLLGAATRAAIDALYDDL